MYVLFYNLKTTNAKNRTKSRQNKFDVQCLGEQMPHLLCTVTKARSNPAVMATL